MVWAVVESDMGTQTALKLQETQETYSTIDHASSQVRSHEIKVGTGEDASPVRILVQGREAMAQHWPQSINCRSELRYAAMMKI